MEKTRLTYEYIATSYQYFKSATKKVQNLYSSLENEGKTRVVFYGAGEFAEIAFHAIAGTKIRLVALVDPKRKGEQFFDYLVEDSSHLLKSNYNVILITMVNHHESIMDEIKRLGISVSKIRFF